jgi:hypothetical protein
METITQPLIFKTDIGELCANCTVHKTLDSHTGVQYWSIDHDDADCVLRIISDTLTASMVIEMIHKLGHECQELS